MRVIVSNALKIQSRTSTFANLTLNFQFRIDSESSSESFKTKSFEQKKAPFATGLQLFIFFRYILQQSHPSFKKEVKIETIKEILLCHFFLN